MSGDGGKKDIAARHRPQCDVAGREVRVPTEVIPPSGAVASTADDDVTSNAVVVIGAPIHSHRLLVRLLQMYIIIAPLRRERVLSAKMTIITTLQPPGLLINHCQRNNRKSRMTKMCYDQPRRMTIR